MSQRVVEQRLSLLLKDFEKKMYLNYMSKAGGLKNLVYDSDLENRMKIITAPDSDGVIAFRFLFDLPIHIILSHPICRFKSKKKYFLSLNWYMAKLGLIPVYFASMNTIALLRRWGDQAESFFSPVNVPIPEDEIVCWELSNESRRTEYSTMNFILGHGCRDKLEDNDVRDVFEKYLKLGYWSFPRKGFTSSTQIFHNREKITCTMKVCKSLYVINKIVGAPKKIPTIEGHKLNCILCYLKGLNKTDGAYVLDSFPVLIEEELAGKIAESGKSNYGFINGMITEVRHHLRLPTGTIMDKIPVFTVVQDYGDSYSDLVKSLIGIICHSSHINSNSSSFVGKLDQIKKQVTKVFQRIYRHIDFIPSVADIIEDSFKISINDMFPVVVVDKDDVFYTHPIVISFLLSTGKKIGEIEKDKKILVYHLKLLHKIPNENSFRLFLSDEAQYLISIGYPKKSLLSNIKKVSDIIEISKNVKKTFDMK